MTAPPLQAVVAAVAQHLHDAGVAYWPGPTGTYPKRMPRPPAYAKRLQADPQTALAVNAYQLDDNPDPGQAVATVWVQVRARAPMDADPLADAARQALHGQHNTVWAGVRVARCTHESTAQLGADPASGLDERTDNYRIEVTR